MVRLSLTGVLAAVLLCAAVHSDSVSAHANLTRSTPVDGAVVLRSPGEIVFVFSEPVVVEESTVQVSDSTGVARDNGDFHHHGDAANPGLTVAPDLPDGHYTVTWDVSSANDGHRTSGAFAFTVGSSPRATSGTTPSASTTDVAPEEPGVSTSTPAASADVADVAPKESGGSALIFVLAGIAAGILVLGAVGVALIRRRS